MGNSLKIIKVLQVVGNMNRGGAETFLMNVLRNIDKEKFELLFLCYGDAKFDYEDEIKSLGGKIVRLPGVKDSGIRRHIQNLRDIITQNSIDVVHAHTYYNSIFSLIAAKLCGVRIRIVHSHTTKSEPNPSIIKRIYFWVSEIGIDLFANKFVACGDDAGKALYLPWRKFQVIYNGIDINNFAHNESVRTEVRKELGINSNATVLMHTGRFVEVKNHNFLIDVFDEYKKINTNSQLILIGVGPLEDEIATKVKKLKLSNSVTFLGLRSDVNRICNAADIFVFPSLFEGLPIVLVEAQANGIKCLVSDTVDKNIKLTVSLEFYSLLNDAKAWAQRIAEIGFNRADTTRYLINGAYDMSANIKDIENIYADEK